MSTSTKRRHDDYRPASLRTFWQWLYRLWWGFEDRMAKWYGYAVLSILVLVVIALLCLAGYILAFLFQG